jgi:hypothetical protein
MKKYRQGARAQARAPLKQAWQLYGQLGLRANQYGAELDEKLVEASVTAGREALLRADLVAAFASFKDAARLAPDDARARAGLVELERKADELYGLAYVQKESEPQEALRKFIIVVQVTDPASALHEKAQNLVAALRP